MRALTFAEDLCLLLQDDALGDLHPLEGRTLVFGLATAALLELAQHDRIDTDLANLQLVDPTPLGDPIADLALALIAGSTETHPPEYWIRRIGLQLGTRILDAARDRLCERGILERDPGDHFFLAPAVAHAKRYPGVEGDSAEEVKVRVMRILFNEEIPQPWEADLIGPAAACRVFEKVLSPREFDRVGARIEAVQSLNLLCRAGRIAIDEDLEASRSAPQQQYKPIPKVPGLPLLGNALSMTGDLNDFFIKLYRRHGPIFRIRVPGRRIVVLAGQEANSFVLRHARTHLRSNREFSEFCRAMETDRAMISMDGADHVRLRRVAQAGYSREVIERDIDQAIEIARHHVTSWPVGSRLRAFETMQRIVTEQVGILATGLSPRDYIDDLKYYFDTLIFAVRRDRPRFMYAHRMPRVRGRIRQLCREVIELHDPDLRKGCPRDVIDAFLELHRKYVLMEASDAEVRAWRRGYMKVVKKATYMHGGKRVVQKATPNLGRLPQIMEMFPGAYYIHIVRNPYDLYPSYMHMLSTLTRSYTMEDYDPAELEAGAVRMYQRIMQNYLRDRSSIPSDRFIEMRFEDLRRNPVGEIGRIYRSFDLDWERAEPPIAAYAATLSSYKQNQYGPDPRVREQVDAHWRFAVDEWNYGSPPSETS